MKNIFLYTPYWNTFGGGEKYVLCIASILAQQKNVKVALLSTSKDVDKKSLEKFSNYNLSNIDFIKTPDISGLRNVIGKADCFICQSNVKKVVTYARAHVQILQIPYKKIDLSSMSAKFLNGKFKESLKDIMRLQLLSFSRTRASLVLSYSKFVKDVLQYHHQIKSEVLNPPIQNFYIDGYSKKNIVLSVGRFFSGLYNNKRYDILTEAFRKAAHKELAGWEYHLVGTASNDPATQRMIRALRQENKNYPVYFHIDEPYESLKKYYNEASIFWHAAGYQVDEKKNPENVEHFGMTTAEAMSAGCIPVVINKGGQPEIVTHGQNGFLWNSIDELVSLSGEVARNKIQISQLQKAAIKRSRNFGLEQFGEHLLKILSPFL